MTLGEYKRKRKFSSTPEPEGTLKVKGPASSDGLKFVVQLHRATRLHYDFRLEVAGVMKSWAVPKGPSLDPMERRLAVEVEDHPVAYNDFEGVIPPGNYGAGTVMIWDEGTYIPRSKVGAKEGSFSKKSDSDEIQKSYEKGHITFVVEGSKLQGEFALVKLKNQEGKNWLLLKKRDAHSSPRDVTLLGRSVRTNRDLAEIAATAVAEKRIWISNAKTSPSNSLEVSSKSGPIKSAKLQRDFRRIGTILKQYESLLVAATLQNSRPVTKWLPARGIPTVKPYSNELVQPIYEGYYGTIAVTAKGQCYLRGKNNLLLNKRFPDLFKEVSTLEHLFDSIGPIFIAGYIVPVDSSGNPRPLGKSDQKTPSYRFFILDLLHVNHFDLNRLPLTVRLEILAELPLKTLELVKVPGVPADQFDFMPGKHYLKRKNIESAGSNEFERQDARLQPRKRAAQGDSKTAAANEVDRSQGALSKFGGTQFNAVVHRGDRSAVPQVVISNQKRIYWPKEAISKGDLIAYYREIAPYMLPHLADRPESLNRFPEGIGGKSFFQKEVTGHLPRWIDTATLSSGRSGKSVTYALVNKLEDLLFLVNMGCIEINIWLSQVTRINEPDYVVFDLDPGEVSFQDIVLTAKKIKEMLDLLKAPAYLKTSGGRGLHIYVPITQGHSFDEVRSFAETISGMVHRQLPNLTSLERSPVKRTHKIYLDFLQNRIGQTMAAIYSARPRPGAMVSTPLSWDELTTALDVKAFHIKSIPARLKLVGDLWKDMGQKAKALKTYQKKLATLVYE